MKMRLLFFLFTLLGQALYATINPTQLTCEYLPNPSVVDVLQPRLAWINIADKGERGQYQTAWQVRVASSKDKVENPDLWDSKKVTSNQSNRVKYNGKPLASRQECWWQVRVWDKNGKVSAWSEPAMWRMGLLQPTDWKAEWIGAPWQGEEALPKPVGGPDAVPKTFPPPAPMFRKKFAVTKDVAKAVAFVTGLGYFEFYLNGAKVGDDVLVPNQTNYGKRPDLIKENIPLEDNFREYKVMYLAYDIKDRLKKGDNVAGSILGNGFYNPAKYWMGAYGSPRFLGQIHITYTDGSEDVIVSDGSWKVAQSPILMDMVYYGEHYDARKEQTGWCAAAFNDANWQAAVKRKAPEGKLVAHTAYTDKVTKKLQPTKIVKTDSGTYKVDFAEEISGWLRFNNVQGPAGHKIEVKFNGNLYSGDNSYIFKGSGPENYAPRFNWFVFSGVEIFNWPGELKPEHLTAEAVNTHIEETAKFETSNQLFNDINRIWKRSQLDNMHGGLASDCPHRERAGYTGDGQVACVTVMHNFNAQNFYHKWIQDILGAQNVSTGYVPNGAPWEPGCGGGVAWGAAINIMPWEYYLHYGAKDMLEDNYVGMKEYIRYMQTWVNNEGIMHSQAKGKDGKPLKWLNLGDWAAPDKLVDDALVHTFYFWRCADLTAKAAKALGRQSEAKQYSELAQRTWNAFHQKFYDEAKGSYGAYGGNIFALKMGVPANRYKQVIAAVKADIAANDGHLDTGIFGTQFFFEILSEHGMHELAYEAMNKRTMPGFGYWLTLGSTTTREQWDNSGSHNHPMFGGGITWFYRKLAGMNADPVQPGYKHIIFRPQPVKDMDYVTYTNQTAYGEAGINWKQDGNRFQMEVNVPVGSKATVYVPAEKNQTVLESGKHPAASGGVRSKSVENGYQVFEVGSGQYHFSVQ